MRLYESVRATTAKLRLDGSNPLGTDLFEKIFAYGTDLICRCME